MFIGSLDFIYNLYFVNLVFFFIIIYQYLSAGIKFVLIEKVHLRHFYKKIKIKIKCNANK